MTTPSIYTPEIALYLISFFLQDGETGYLVPNSLQPLILPEAQLAVLISGRSEVECSAFLVTPLRLQLNAGLNLERGPYIDPQSMLSSLTIASEQPHHQNLYFPGGKIMTLSEFLDLPGYLAEIQNSPDQNVTRSRLQQQVTGLAGPESVILPRAFNADRLSIPIPARHFLTAVMLNP